MQSAEGEGMADSDGGASAPDTGDGPAAADAATPPEQSPGEGSESATADAVPAELTPTRQAAQPNIREDLDTLVPPVFREKY